MPAGGLVAIVAKPKVGKTTMAEDLSVAVARGDDWLGRPTEQGAVLYLALRPSGTR